MSSYEFQVEHINPVSKAIFLLNEKMWLWVQTNILEVTGETKRGIKRFAKNKVTKEKLFK